MKIQSNLKNIFDKNIFGYFSLFIVCFFCIIAIYAPLLASSKPLIVKYDGEWYFPLFRYLFYSGYYTKELDLFFNLLMFTAPFMILAIFKENWLLYLSVFIQFGLFLLIIFFPLRNPESNLSLTQERKSALKASLLPNFNFDLKYMTPYAKLDLLINYQQQKQHHSNLERYVKKPSTIWQQHQENEKQEIELLRRESQTQEVIAEIRYITEKQNWLEKESQKLHYQIMPLIRPFHWQDDAGGNQNLNASIPFWELTRINRGDLVAALIFGTRISIVVGILSVALSLAIGLPLGAIAGYYGGTIDIVISRFLEIWEAMPTFFMLLLAIAMMQSKSIFLVISIIGLFGWTSFSRYLRGEFLKQRHLSYVDACRASGFSDSYIMFSHILPNAIPPILSLLPFAIMGAIISEAGLSFLGLGEENSCSWGVLMDEGRSAFPSEAYLLWPPAILLTILLIAIAIVGDLTRDALDPKEQ